MRSFLIRLWVGLLLVSPSAQQKDWITQCKNIVLQDWETFSCNTTKAFSSDCPKLVDALGHVNTNLTPENAWGISIRDCYARCNNINNTFSFANFSSATTNWLLPWLALTAQLPYETPGPFQNVLSGLLAVGSPAHVSYGLALTMLAKVRINEKFSALAKLADDGPVSEQYANFIRRLNSARLLLVESLQTPMRAWDGQGWLSKLILQEGYHGFWRRLERNLRNTRRGVTISLVAQLLFAVIAWIFTIASAFSELGDVTVGLSISSSSLWLWMIPVIAGWVSVGTQRRPNTISSALRDSFYDRRGQPPRQNGINNCSKITVAPFHPSRDEMNHIRSNIQAANEGTALMGDHSPSSNASDGGPVPAVSISAAEGEAGSPFLESQSPNHGQHLPSEVGLGVNSIELGPYPNSPQRRDTHPGQPSSAGSPGNIGNIPAGSLLSAESATMMARPSDSEDNRRTKLSRTLTWVETTQTIPSKKTPQIWGVSYAGDEAMEGPIFNYARIFTSTRFVDIVAKGFKTSMNNIGNGDRPTGRWDRRQTIWENLKGDDHEISTFCGFGEGQDDRLRAYPQWSEIPARIYRDIGIASLFALAVQWGTTGPSIWMSITTPTKGVSCRSGGYLIYGAVATLSWFLMLTSSFLSHALMLRAQNDPREVTDRKESRTILAYLYLFTRYLGRYLACLNAVFLLILTILQLCGVLDNCRCTGVRFAYGLNGWLTIFKGAPQLEAAAQPVWVGGVVIAAATCLFGWAFIWLGARPDSRY